MIVVFDAHCLLCSGSVRWLLRRDKRKLLRFASAQSEAGRELLTLAGVDILDPQSFVVVDGQRHYTESAAVLRIVGALGWPWRVLRATRLVPAPLRDAIYRWIARNRYRWFGRREVCFLPDPADARRFIG